MLHTFGVWYFETGWIIATVLGLFAGVFTCYTEKPGRNLAAWCVLILLVGAIAAYGKCHA